MGMMAEGYGIRRAEDKVTKQKRRSDSADGISTGTLLGELAFSMS